MGYGYSFAVEERLVLLFHDPIHLHRNEMRCASQPISTAAAEPPTAEVASWTWARCLLSALPNDREGSRVVARDRRLAASSGHSRPKKLTSGMTGLKTEQT
jgi:hypothetical protein